MEEELMLLLCLFLDKKGEDTERRRHLKMLRDNSDPFSMPESMFIKRFRFPKALCRELIQQLEPHEVQKSKLPFTIRFLSALYFYAQGCYQKNVGKKSPISISQPSVSRTLEHISKTIVRAKGGEIRFPQSAAELAIVKEGFYKMFGIEGTIGVIDCTHISIKSQPTKVDMDPHSLYLNTKGRHSINVEAVCDHLLCFTSVNAKFPGSCPDSGIWKKSRVRQNLIKNSGSLQRSWLLGDESYPLEPWLLTPITSPSNPKEIKFNQMHEKARSTIEKAFSVLQSRFRCLSEDRVLHYSHDKAAYIIYACAILHNILMKKGIALQMEGGGSGMSDTDVNDVESVHLEGQRVRSTYIASMPDT